jgi:hypothetical protein
MTRSPIGAEVEIATLRAELAAMERSMADQAILLSTACAKLHAEVEELRTCARAWAKWCLEPSGSPVEAGLFEAATEALPERFMDGRPWEPEVELVHLVIGVVDARGTLVWARPGWDGWSDEGTGSTWQERVLGWAGCDIDGELLEGARAVRLVARVSPG